MILPEILPDFYFWRQFLCGMVLQGCAANETSHLAEQEVNYSWDQTVMNSAPDRYSVRQTRAVMNAGMHGKVEHVFVALRSRFL